jgi:hypothetical protein
LADTGQRLPDIQSRAHAVPELSPFDEGGINAYAYCGGEPINCVDPSGHFARFMALGAFGIGVVSGVGAVASHFSRAETARNIFGAVALGAFTISAMAGAAYLIPMSELQMQVCFGANRGPMSIAQGELLAQRLATELNLPVTGFLGVVRDVGKRLTYKVGYERRFLPQKIRGMSVRKAPSHPALDNPTRVPRP